MSTENKKDEEKPQEAVTPALKPVKQPEGERGGPQGPEPTRYGDWEQAGRCTDF